MKKTLYFLMLFCICFTLTSGKKHKHKKKKEAPAQVSVPAVQPPTIVIETPPVVEIVIPVEEILPPVVEVSAPIAKPLPFEKIHGELVAELVQYIREFPQESYKSLSIQDQGEFYMDETSSPIRNETLAVIKEKAKPGTTVVDLGAHNGIQTLTLSQAVGPSGHVVAFEAQPKLFRELFMNMARNGASNVDFYWSAASDFQGAIELSTLHFGNGENHVIPAVTLDSLNLENVSLIKIDVEGMENNVIDGARETLIRNKPTLIIVAADPETTIAKLHALNYEVSDLEGHLLATPRQENTLSDTPEVTPELSSSDLTDAR